MAFGMLKALWLYRGFVLGSVRREFASRYLGSTLGALWSVIHPVVLVLVYTIIFTEVMRARLPGANDEMAYGIYLCAGILTWTLFSEIVTRSQTVFFENSNLLKKASLPRICFPAILVLTALTNFLIVFGTFLVILALTGRFPGWVVLDCLPVLVVEVAFATGLGILTGTLNVFIRDIGQMVNVVMQFWFWLTPIVYPPSILPASFREWIGINPMTSVMAAYQSILVEGRPPAWPSLLPVALLAVAALGLGLLAFRKSSGDLVDEL